MRPYPEDDDDDYPSFRFEISSSTDIVFNAIHHTARAVEIVISDNCLFENQYIVQTSSNYKM